MRISVPAGTAPIGGVYLRDNAKYSAVQMGPNAAGLMKITFKGGTAPSPGNTTLTLDVHLVGNDKAVATTTVTMTAKKLG